MAGDTNVNICDFTVKEVKCSQEQFINISELSTSKQMNICSSTNSLPSFVNNKQRICNAHLKHFDNKLSLRKLKPTCNLPDTMKHLIYVLCADKFQTRQTRRQRLATHTRDRYRTYHPYPQKNPYSNLTHTLTPMARKRKSTSYRPKNANTVKVNLDSQWCREIAYITGLILPLGTGMCGVCYKRLRQEKKAIETGVADADEIAGADETTEFQKQSSKRKRHDSETDELREVEEVADHDFNITNQLIPGMTRYRFYDSPKHSKTVGVGMPVVTAEKCLRQRIPPALLDHFIRHITSSEVIKDLPFGEKTLRLTNGEILVIPSVVRSLAPKAIIDQYVEMCKEQGIKHLGESFMFKILRQCSATVRKSVEGLDNFVMEGSRAFMELLLQLGRKDLHRRLMEVKKYLKTDFKRNLSQHTSVKDHCINHALSFDAGCFVRECDSDHPDLCTQCMDVKTTILK